MGTIAVYFKQITEAGNDDYFHEFIVWTSDRGLQSYIRGGPNSRGHYGSRSGGGSGSSGFDIGHHGTNIPFGSILVQSGLFQAGSPDYPQTKKDAYPRQVVKSGSDSELEPAWNKMVAVGNIINKANISYAVAGPNSNTVASTLLQAAGLPQPKGNDLDGSTPAPGADMSLLDRRYSTECGDAELAANVAVRGLRDIRHGIGTMTHDIGDDVGAAIREFRKALGAAAATGKTDAGRMGVYEVAMAAGRQGLGGFAPGIAGSAGRRRTGRAVAAGDTTVHALARGGAGPAGAGDGARFSELRGEVGFAPAGRIASNSGGTDVAPGQGAGAEVSYRAAVARARGDAAAGRVRREEARAALYLPARRAALAEESLAPQPGGTAGAGGLFQPRARDVASIAAFRRRASLADAVAVGEAGSAQQREVEDQHYGAIPPSAPAQLAPFDMERALDDYFFRKSRLPPAGGAGFNPLLSPVWAGLKIPG
jgi:hypothetical protein